MGGLHPEVGQGNSGVTPSESCVEGPVFGAISVRKAV